MHWVSIIEIIIASSLWGAGFVAAKFALLSFSPHWINTIRFFTVSLLLIPILFTESTKLKFYFKNSILLGLFLTLAIFLQLEGLKETSATISSFLAVLYVLIVPFLEIYYLKSKLPKSHFFFVFLSLAGVLLMVIRISNNEKFSIQTGDIYILLSTLFSTAHIVLIEKLGPQIEKPFLFNLFQCFWGFLFSLIPSLFTIHTLTPPKAEAILGLSFLIIGPTLIAFYLQIRAQKNIPPSIASLLFLLESPFGALTAFFLLSETLTLWQWVGAAMIFSSCALCVLRLLRKSPAATLI